MKKIYIGFSTPKKQTLISKIIRLLQQTDYSHAYIKFYSESLDRNIIYQASGLQVNFIGSELFKDHHLIIEEYCFEIDEQLYTKTLQFAVDKAGTPYSIKQLLHILIYMSTGIISSLNDGRSGYICSELVSEILEKFFNWSITEDLDLITPKDVNNLIKIKLYGSN